MAIKVIQSGDEAGVREVVGWLERHGIPKRVIRGVTITGNVGEPLMITPTIIIEDPAELDALADHEITNLGDPRRTYLQPDGTVRVGERVTDERE